MLQLTKRTEYGLIALVHMVDRAGEFVSVREIGDRYPVPRRLLAEVLKDLQRANLLESQRGALGGYQLARPADQIALSEVIAAIEGTPSLTSCETLGAATDGACEVESTCPIRSPIHRVRKHFWDLMQHTTLRSLASPEPNHTAAHPLHASREPAT